ncbi:TorF family putative porin [Herbaspirillum sp. alder98]|uniref:TorF family putative porin n=1 Tax=Herbaspirillum sp. alder98 TaxID=2913096 RepID=UPI001CD884B6|nr:TorF family putative porin [Herbaspirillum sp. alder98]MCA1326905.1 TorF family putative porin [Herbaspirillum sp. alder98]
MFRLTPSILATPSRNQSAPTEQQRLRDANRAGAATLAGAGLLLAIAMAAPAAHAEEAASAFHPSANIGVASQYVFRGLTQTNGRPALQGGFDLSHDSGLYGGTWMSNVSWISDTNPAASASLEADFYAGWKPALNDWLNADMGVLRYAYPGSYPVGMTHPDTTELYLGLDAKWITFKYSYSLGNTFGAADTRGTSYADLGLSHELLGGITGVAHIGRQRYTGASASALSYTDWKLGLTRDFSGYLLGLFYTDSNASDAGYTLKGKNIGRSQLVLSMTKSF